MRGDDVGNRERLVFEVSDVIKRQRSCKFCQAGGGGRPLPDRTAAAGFCCWERKNALKQGRHGTAGTRKTGRGGARVISATAESPLALLSVTVVPKVGGRRATSL